MPGKSIALDNSYCVAVWRMNLQQNWIERSGAIKGLITLCKYLQGAHVGDAVGFRLSSLPTLVDLRANKPRMTLLHYVATVIYLMMSKSFNCPNPEKPCLHDALNNYWHHLGSLKDSCSCAERTNECDECAFLGMHTKFVLVDLTISSFVCQKTIRP